MDYIKQADIKWMLAAVLIYFTAFVIRAFRWKYILAPIKVLPVKRLFSYVLLGFFMNNLLPLRLGEFVRAYVSGKKLSVSKSSMLATIVLERLLDGLSYLVLFLFVMMFLPFPEWAKKSLVVGNMVFVLGMLFLFYISKREDSAHKFLSFVPIPDRFKDKLTSVLSNFISGLQIFKDWKGMLTVFVLSILVWITEGFVYYSLTYAFNIDINFYQSLFVMIIIGMGAILPPAPGYVGTVEFLGVTSLAFFAVEKNLAFGFILTLHFIQLLTITILGLHSIITEKISFSELIHIEK